MSIQSVTAAAHKVAALTDTAKRARREVAVAVERMASEYERQTAEAAEVKTKHGVVTSAAQQARASLERALPASAEPDRANAARWDYVVMRRPDGSWRLREDVLPSLERDLREVSGRLARKNWRQTEAGLMRQSSGNIARAWSIVHGLDAEREKLAKQLADITDHASTLAESTGAQASSDLRMITRALIEQQRDLSDVMVPWLSRSWSVWTPPATPVDTVYIGAVKLRAGQVPPPNQRFGLDVSIPTFTSVRDGMRINHDRQSRSAAHSLVRSVLLRALAATPPGKLRLSIFDPLGLGQSVASLLELGEFDRELLGGKVWSTAEDLRQVLAGHVAQIELVLQKYLRAEYESLEAFNAAAGEIAEPYRVVVVFDAPERIDDQAFAELRRIIANGPRCGIATILITDSSASTSYGVDLSTLPESLGTVSLTAAISEQVNSKYVLFDFVPETDQLLGADVSKSIIELVGLGARESTTSAVSFERVFDLFAAAAFEGRKRELPPLESRISAADAASWWRQTTVEGVASPIGLRGARDVATLTFDSSNHAGALLVGRPGSGKSTLLHTFLAGITTMYGPEELELHLIDFKEGVEFKVYAANGLPHARTVAIESDREFGVSVLQAIQGELTWRGSLLRGSSESHSSFETLRKATGERLPRIVLVFDEFQVLFARNDKLGGVAAEALEMLIRQGCGFGIHVLLGSQSLSGLDALGSHVPQLLPVRILLPAAESDAFKVLGEGNTEGAALTAAGDGILNAAGGAVEANERFRGALIDEESRRARVTAMRTKADQTGFTRRPVIFEGNAPIPAEDTSPEQFADEIRGADARTLRLRFGAPMALSGSADINLRREAGANMLLVARDAGVEGVVDSFSLPKSVASNVVISAVAQGVTVEIIDFLPPDEGLETSINSLCDAGLVTVTRRRQVPALLKRFRDEVGERVEAEDTSRPTRLLVLYGMHRARDFDQESVDYDAEINLPETLTTIMRDGPEVGIHVLLWLETVAAISRRLPSAAVREVTWRLAGKMSADDSSSFVGVEGSSSLREQQLLIANEDRGELQRCTTISAPGPDWTRALLSVLGQGPKE